MQTLQLKATLTGTTPAVWRTLAFHPETGLEQLHDMLLIVMGWDDENAPVFLTNDGPITPDDDAYFEASINEYFVNIGDIMSYSLDTEDEFLVELELTALADEGEDAQLPRVIAGKNQAPPENSGGVAAYNDIQEARADANNPRHTEAKDKFSGVMDTRYFNAEEVNEEARELFDDEGGEEFGFAATDQPEDTNDLEDADATAGEISFKPAWLEAEHGIKASEGNVREVPQDIIDFRTNLTEADLETPRKYLRKIRPLFEKHPENALLNFEMAGLYGLTGEGKKSRQLMRKVNREFSDDLEVLIHRALSMDDEEDFSKAIAALPRPLDIRNHPAGKDGYYQTTEFLGFEELAIRDAVINGDLEAARLRLDRLVRFGFLHGDVEQSAIAIAGMMVIELEDRIQSGELQADASLSDAFKPLAGRTDAILKVSMKEVGEMMREYEENFAPPTVRREGPKVGRNDPCPCGSRKKFKKCCINNQA